VVITAIDPESATALPATIELACRIEHSGARVPPHEVERESDTLVPLPAGSFDLHLFIVDDAAGDGLTPLRDEVRRLDLTAGVELEVDLGLWPSCARTRGCANV